MSQQKIRSAFESRLKTWADAQAPPIPIAFENVPFVPPNQARYLRAFLLPGKTNNGRWLDASARTMVGLYQVSVCVPEGSGPAAAESVADALVAQFTNQLLMPSSGIDVRVMGTPYTSPAMREPGLFVLPVSIAYRADILPA